MELTEIKNYHTYYNFIWFLHLESIDNNKLSGNKYPKLFNINEFNTKFIYLSKDVIVLNFNIPGEMFICLEGHIHGNTYPILKIWESYNDETLWTISTKPVTFLDLYYEYYLNKFIYKFGLTKWVNNYLNTPVKMV